MKGQKVMNRQLKMQIADIPEKDLERWARDGVTKEIVDQRMRHRELDRRFPGVLAAAIRQLRAAPVASNGNGHAPAVEQERPKRVFSAAARKKISIAQKRRWAKQKRSA
jgi:hypothetical protein